MKKKVAFLNIMFEESNKIVKAEGDFFTENSRQSKEYFSTVFFFQSLINLQTN